MKYKSPEATLKECEESEIYLEKLHEKLLEYKAEYRKKEQEEC